MHCILMIRFVNQFRFGNELQFMLIITFSNQCGSANILQFMFIIAFVNNRVFDSRNIRKRTLLRLFKEK